MLAVILRDEKSVKRGMEARPNPMERDVTIENGSDGTVTLTSVAEVPIHGETRRRRYKERV